MMPKINEAMIFAAGFGKRMLPLTKTIPKPLVRVKNKPLINYIIEELLNLNFKNIVVNTHYLPDKLNFALKKYFPIVKTINETEILDTGGGLVNAINKNYFNTSRNPIVLLNGDVFWKKKKKSPIKNLLDSWDEDKMDLLLCVKKKNDLNGYKGIGDLNLIKPEKKISEANFNTIKDFVFSGLQIINPNILNLKKKKFSISEIFFSDSYKIYGIEDKNDWYHISTPDDLLIVNKK